MACCRGPTPTVDWVRSNDRARFRARGTRAHLRESGRRHELHFLSVQRRDEAKFPLLYVLGKVRY